MMAWIFDTYSMNKGHSVLGVVTGKPLAIGGSLGREEATARGALYCHPRGAARSRAQPFDGLRVAVQGFGNVGRHLARFLAEDGAKVVARLGLARRHLQPDGHRRRGRDRATSAETGSLAGLAGPRRSRTRSCSCSTATLLAPCALEQVITARERGPGDARR